MTSQEKLSRLLEHCNKRSVARAAGIDRQTLAAALAGANQPRLATLRAIAAALHVDFGWLADDSKAWPPVRVCEAVAVA